ncbi:hypothetical protein DPX16_7100 [Anabarilius grahami]|uniref:HAT C-terminal dimerisation domain-containing protein n=1 Tax=Anabarilius grahami TaxID=495550 RepID=A0A3N0XJD0_ANAGA|nr:hypothetical protein DPX16_7100 [Anabarilius grahami]
MVAAFKQTTAEETSSDFEDSPVVEDDSDSETDDDLRYHHVDLDRTLCVVHTLQLVVNMVQKEACVKRILDKARDLSTLAHKMKTSVNQRFAWLLDPTDEKFSPLVAAACFVNPTVCETLVDVADDNIEELLKHAEEYVIKKSTLLHTQEEDHSEDDAEEENPEKPEDAPSSLKPPVFRFLSKCRRRPKQKTSMTSVREQIKKYKEELSKEPITEETGIDFWLAKSDTFYHKLKPFALDLLAMPASQAFAERVFSVTGDLSRGRRNKARVTLAQSAFLKMNRTK